MKENLDQNTNNIKSNNKILTGMFADSKSLAKAYESLHERGYVKDEINVIMSDETHKKYFSQDDSEMEITSKSAENAGKGLAIGSSIGAIVVGVMALIAIPVAGTIAVALAGASVGAVAGGIVGALVGLEIPEQYAKIYESGIAKGYIVLGIHPHSEVDAQYFKKTWLAYKGEEIYY